MLRSRILYSVLFSSPLLLAQQWPRQEEDHQQAARERWFYEQRAFPNASIPAGARLNAIRQLRQVDAAARQRHRALAQTGASLTGLALDSATWTSIGPRPTNGTTASATTGRCNAIAIDPRNNNVMYIGAASGGVWKTTDGGVNWTPITDDQPSLATGAIVIDPSAPDTVYVGTGEENNSGDSYYGAGILKSTDGGATWTNILGPFLRDRIGSLAIQPGNSSVLLAASQGGIWRSADAGQTWRNVQLGIGTTVVFDPTDGTSAFAAVGSTAGSTRNGIYHSTDGGATWRTSNGTGSTALPAGTAMGRIEIAMAPSAPTTIYAQVEDIATKTSGDLLGIWKTTDGGATWNQLPIPASQIQLWGVDLWYFNAIAVHPTNPDVVWAGGLQLFRTVDGGQTWSVLPQTGPNRTSIHVDNHRFAYTPDGSRLIIANDGGIWSTTDVINTTVNWNSLNGTLAVTQFYPGVSMDASDPQFSLGGTQDNGTQRYDGGVNWSNSTCGDGGFTAVDSSAPGLVYASCQNISVERTLPMPGALHWVGASYGFNQSDNTNFISPLVIDEANTQTLYFGTFRLWRSTNGADRWSPVSADLTGGVKGANIKSIAIAPSDSNTLYIGTINAKVQVTRDMNDGASSGWSDISAGLPVRSVTKVAVDPIDAATAYVSFSGFSNGSTDKFGHVFRTNNAGTSWTDISGNLPNIPVNDLIVDPDMPQTLYIATDAGVMVTTDGGNTWSTLGNGLPAVVVDALVLQRKNRMLRAGTHGRSVWDILVPITGGAGIQPLIASLAPATVDVASGAFKLTVTGTNFTSGTIVRWNGLSRPTTFVDNGHLTASIPAGDVAVIGRSAITAFNPVAGGGSSNTVPFLIGTGPQSAANAIVSAANPTGGNNLSVRSIASLYGTNLAPGTDIADQGPPLPLALNGTFLTMLSGAQTIPLYFVSQGQINFQVPAITLGPQQLIITQGTRSVTIPVNLVNYAPALFSTNAQGTGQAATIVANTAIVAAPVGTYQNSRPAKIGEFVSIYCTGLGPTNNQPVLGGASPSNPLATTQAQPTVTIGGVKANIIFSGLAPGFVGLYQVNAQVPATSPVGDAIPIVLTIGGVTSNTVTIAVDPAQ